jgi:folate-binding Fe-S cluster repair protein YgfZ
MPNPPEIQEQYRAVMTVGGVYARADRGMIEVRGKDRAAWLNNLVTNVVKTLQPGEGNYAFATSVTPSSSM